MKRIFLSTLALTTLGTSAQDLQSALTQGKASLEIRTRYEYDNDDAAQFFTAPSTKVYRPETATALTNRTILGYKTGDFFGVSASLQFLDVSTILGVDNFNDGFNGKTDHAKVSDPHQDRILQGFLAWKGLKIGRQTLSVDNQRFIGAGAWSQAPKSYTGATFLGNFGLPWMELHAGYLSDVLLSDGTHRDANLRFARVRFTPLKALAITPFYYATDVSAYTPATVPVGTAVTPQSSLQHRGLRADGSWKGLLYEASYAQQRPYRDGTEAKVPSSLYRMGMLGYQYQGYSLKVVREALESGFSTPDASLHGFYGWSDRVATTSTKGLVDSYLQASAKTLGLEIEAQYHLFKAETDGTKFGKELDLQVNYPLTKSFSVLAKYADYKGDSEATGLTGVGSTTKLYLEKDLRKFWFQTTYKF